MTTEFTWIPLYTELARRLLDWENRQPELIAYLDHLRKQGLKVTPLNDKDKEAEDAAVFVIREIDPFTFFGSFNRQVREEERMAILLRIREFLGGTAPLPQDFKGVPLLNNMRSWFIGYQYKRRREDASTLWNLFRLALADAPLENPDFSTAFDAATTIYGVATNLTMALFWIRPDTFLNLDNLNREYLGIELPAEGLSSKFYKNCVDKVRAMGRPLPEISYDAWLAANKQDHKPAAASSVHTANNQGFWLVGAYWNAVDPPDQTERFLAEGIWENGYKDRYLKDVNSIKVGDRIAIKSASTQKNDLPFDARGNTVSKMTIKAIGTVVANRGDGRTIEVEWEPEFQEKDWYFYTDRRTIWRVRSDETYELKEHAQRLVDFVWNGKSQDYEWFANRWWNPELPATPDGEITEDGYEPYSIDDILDSGVFLTEAELSEALDRLRSKKNLILQGAPGVGKTFLARKLAYALMEEKAPDRLEMVQFHQTFSYEDFVRGYRPLPDQPGSFGLQDAVFYKFCQRAADDPERDYVFVIDEINRGNLGQIFGELLMLIEADKRGPEFAVQLVYQKAKEPRFFVPANVHLIGLMNLADRSLAIVDYALRRRFAFLTLTPQYSSPTFERWLVDRQMSPELARLIVQRMATLNQELCEDPLLGANYAVGHSFFCPKGTDFSGLDHHWFNAVIRTEILPLLREYWFDNPTRVQQAEERLLAK